MEQLMKNLYDVVIIGGGPAGLTAALYLARARYRVVVVEKEHFGGQITITSEVVNFPGVERTSGTALTGTMQKQARSFGAEFLLAEALQLSDTDKDIKTVETSRGTLRCFGILLAAGAHPRMIGFQGEREFKGHGVAYCATCDGEFFTGKEVFVAGGGFAAAEESVFLTKYASHVTILIREEDFTCAKAVADTARHHEKITVLTNTEIEEVSGDSLLRYLRYRNNETGKITEYRPPEGSTFGLFVFAGYAPATELVKDLAKLDSQGYLITDKAQQTSLPGVYAAGDICIKPLRQVVTAVGDGALAATELERIASLAHKKTGLTPVVPDERPVKPPLEDQEGGLFDSDMLKQLQTVFSRMESDLCLKLFLDDSPLSFELKAYMTELCTLTKKLTLSISEQTSTPPDHLPCVQICRPAGDFTGLAFHGVPGGHEFTSFVLGLYNAAGAGQAIDKAAEERIRAIDKAVRIQLLVSLSCTMCPELVIAAQKMASIHPLITSEVYDLNHFPDLKERFHVMSVPCLVINEEHVFFGKKSIVQLLELLEAVLS